MNGHLRKTEKWIEEHRRTIGGGLSAAAAGIHEFISPVEAYYYMVEGRTEDISNKPDVLRGLWLEPVARERSSDVLGMEIEPHNQEKFVYHSSYAWTHALPDGWIKYEGETIPIELKVPRPENWKRMAEKTGFIPSCDIPDYIQCQCVHNATILAAPAIMLACLNPVTMEICSRLYEPHVQEAEALMEAEERFMREHIDPLVPPPPQKPEDLKLLWPQAAAGSQSLATPEIEEMHAELMTLRPQEKSIEHRINALKFEIERFMEDTETLVDQSGRVLATWRTHVVKALDSAALKEARPEVWAEFSKDRPQRMFLPKKPK